VLELKAEEMALTLPLALVAPELAVPIAQEGVADVLDHLMVFLYEPHEQFPL
jgi:hypothetical protein